MIANEYKFADGVICKLIFIRLPSTFELVTSQFNSVVRCCRFP